jgi:hypothetical protein
MEKERAGLIEMRTKSEDALNEARDCKLEAQTERAAAASERQQVEEARKAAFDDRSKVEAIREYFWPAIFRGSGTLAVWRDKLENLGSRADSAAPLLINSLHRYALLRLGGDRADTEELARALQEIGRRAYQFWTEDGFDPERQARAAEEWARAFESELGSPYKVRVVRPGQPKDISWMTFKPGGSAQVTEVETWCVQGPNGIQRAIVR